jgi:hypothetical protein
VPIYDPGNDRRRISREKGILSAETAKDGGKVRKGEGEKVGKMRKAAHFALRNLTPMAKVLML